MRHTNSGEHVQAPVVLASDRHWSGFRPDHIDDLAGEVA